MMFGWAAAEDAAEIFALIDSLRDAPYGTWDEEYPLMEDVLRDVEQALVLLLRDDDGMLLSVITIEESDEFNDMASWDADVARWCELSRLGVAKPAQNRGIARQMIAQAEARAKALGYDGVRFLVGSENMPAQRSYARLGYTICGEAEAWECRWLCYEKRI